MRKRFWNIDFLRFVAAVLIVYCHVLHGNIMPFVKGYPEYAHAAATSRNLWKVVELFFILGGVFLWNSIKASAQTNAMSFIWDKIARLWPALAISLLFLTDYFSNV